MSRLSFAAVLFLLGSAYTEEHNSTIADEKWCSAEQSTCGLHDDDGPWMSLLQQWALSAPENERQGRIMALPPAQGYYVSDRIDGPMLSPPPPPAPARPAAGPAPARPAARPYDEWQHTPPPPPSTGKIVNRPPNPYKDQFRPSYPAPSQNQPIPVHGPGVDRVDENRQPPQKMVSETDLYLLSAIEKLVYRADLMEKRMRKMEQTVHYLVAGVDNKPDPCAENFTRVGDGCYHVSSEQNNWKGASYACRRLKANMLEIDSEQEQAKLTSAFIADQRYKDGEFWTGGLNPGLLWIWSHSAKPVFGNSTSAGGSAPAAVAGGGRCLAWGRAAAGFAYRGRDCADTRRYVCEARQDAGKLSNEIDRLARNLRRGRKPNLTWTERDP